MDVLLVHPEIPHNTGCAARLTAATGTALHLVEPLGFSLEDRYLKRAGLDYWPLVDLRVHGDWDAAAAALAPGSARPLAERLRLFTARGGSAFHEVRFAPDDLLVFDLPKGDGWEKLCGFLGHEVPDKPFPHANKASLSRRLKNFFKKL